jgi:hypothetical protein
MYPTRKPQTTGEATLASNQLAPRMRHALEQQEAYAIGDMVTRTRVAQAGMRGIATAAEHGMSEVLHLTRTKNSMAFTCPDAAEALAYITQTASMAIARRVQHLSAELA